MKNLRKLRDFKAKLCICVHLCKFWDMVEDLGLNCVRKFLRVSGCAGPTCMIANGGLRSIQVK